MQRARLSTSGFHGNVTPKWWRHQLESRNVTNMKSREYPVGYISCRSWNLQLTCVLPHHFATSVQWLPLCAMNQVY